MMRAHVAPTSRAIPAILLAHAIACARARSRARIATLLRRALVIARKARQRRKPKPASVALARLARVAASVPARVPASVPASLSPSPARIAALVVSAVSHGRDIQVCALQLREFAFCNNYSLVLSGSDKTRKQAANADKTRGSALLAAELSWTFKADPSELNCARLYFALGFSGRIAHQALDARPEKLMTPDVHAPDIPVFQPKRVNPDSLTWQTKPACGVNPMLVAMLTQAVERVELNRKNAALLRKSHSIRIG